MPKAKIKIYKIHFCVGEIKSSAEGSSTQNQNSISTILSNIQNEVYVASSLFSPDEYYYEIAKHNIEKKGSVFYGVFRKFRKTDLPLIGKAGQEEERNILLDKEEALIEKNFFLYDTNRHVLLYQSTKPGSTYSKLADYIGHVSGTTVDFSIIPRKRLDDFLNNPIQRIKSFDIKIARPTNTDDMIDDSNNWDESVFHLFKYLGAKSIKLQARAGVRTNEGGNSLLDAAKFLVKKSIAHSSETPRGKVHFVDEDNNPSVVDLFLDRLIVDIQVPITENNPRPDSIFSAMKNALFSDDTQNSLDEYLGNP